METVGGWVPKTTYPYCYNPINPPPPPVEEVEEEEFVEEESSVTSVIEKRVETAAKSDNHVHYDDQNDSNISLDSEKYCKVDQVVLSLILSNPKVGRSSYSPRSFRNQTARYGHGAIEVNAYADCTLVGR